MTNQLRFDIADQRIVYKGRQEEYRYGADRIWEFNHRHSVALDNYDLVLEEAMATVLSDLENPKSNLGVMRNRKLRESAILSAALSAVAVGLRGRGSLKAFPKEEITKHLTNQLKRDNDRTAALVMGEVLQITTETLPVGEEVLIASTITEGVRAKPGKEVGGNPTIAVGALFGKEKHRARYGLPMSPSVSLLSMGNDVIEGTTKSVTGEHSSLTAMFLTESNVKRHLPDIYVQRWMSGGFFEEFNPRDASVLDAADVIAGSYGYSDFTQLSSFFLNRARHHPAMDILNDAGVATPHDKDGDLFPGIILGLDGIRFPNQRSLNCMIGEIGGSAEWAVGVLPLVWQGGQALGALTSHSSLTRSDMSAEEKWKERFHFTEEEFIMIQDARFEHKPYFSIEDILEDPFAGGIAAFGAITDNYFLPFMEGVKVSDDGSSVAVNVLTVNSLGTMECWQMVFKANTSMEHTTDLLMSPKEQLLKLDKDSLEGAIGELLSNEDTADRYRLFFHNEYYPAMIPVRDKMVLLPRAIEGLIERKALAEIDREIVAITQRLASNWFIRYD